MSKRTEIREDMLRTLRQTIGGRMSPRRYAHTLAVERAVEQLCRLYAPESSAELRAAALLHDLTKEETLENQLQMCRKFGIMVSPLDVLSPKTFHAKTAAALIAQDFPDFATETVVSAVRWHTTGREGMTLTEQLLYLADYIDDTRTFEDCVRLREAFYGAHPEHMDVEQRLEHLQEVLLLSFDMTIRALLSEGAVVSEDTFKARNDVLMRRTGQ